MATPDDIIQILIRNDTTRKHVLKLETDPACALIVNRTIRARQILAYWYKYLTLNNTPGFDNNLRRIYIDNTRISVRDDYNRERTDQWTPANIEIKISKTEKYTIPVKTFSLEQCDFVEQIYQSMRDREVKQCIISGTKERVAHTSYHHYPNSRMVQKPRKEMVVYAIGERRSYFKYWDGQDSGFTSKLPNDNDE